MWIVRLRRPCSVVETRGEGGVERSEVAARSRACGLESARTERGRAGAVGLMRPRTRLVYIGSSDGMSRGDNPHGALA